MATAELTRTMGQGLMRLEGHLPSLRGNTLYGRIRRWLDTPGKAQGAVDAAGAVGAFLAGMLAQRANERNRSWWERHVHVSAHKRAEEQQRVEAAGLLGGTLGSSAVRGGIAHVDRRDRRDVATALFQYVGFAATRGSGSPNEPNAALLSLLLDAMELDERSRATVEATALPQSLNAVRLPSLDEGSRQALATYAFHACANASPNDLGAAVAGVQPILMRLGFTMPASAEFAAHAQSGYATDRDAISRHYVVLQAAVAGVGRRLSLPFAHIAEATRRVVAYDPYEAARAQNRQAILNVVQSGGSVAALMSGNIAPAMGVAVRVAQQVFGGAAAPQAIEGSFVEFGREASLPPDEVRSWALGA